MMQHERSEDVPPYLKWVMTFINRVGFPILVCIWLAYQQFVAGRETLKALQDFKEAIVAVREVLDQQNKILRHQSKGDEWGG